MQDQHQNIQSYRDLTVWQHAMEVVTTVYRLTKKFPEDEKYGLTSQMRRSAVSIPSNIAEGRSRNSRKDFVQFLHVALGSLSELETQLEIAFQISYVEKVEYTELMSGLERTKMMLFRLIASLKAKTEKH